VVAYKASLEIFFFMAFYLACLAFLLNHQAPRPWSLLLLALSDITQRTIDDSAVNQFNITLTNLSRETEQYRTPGSGVRVRVSK
jgi:hypothetical protein